MFDSCKLPKPAGNGFTMIEVLVSSVVLIMILGIVAQMVGGASDLWMRQRGRASAFEGANTAFETLVRNLAQATLNTYWDYVPADKPTEFKRASALHFQMGLAETLLGRGASFPGSGVFFQAPLGRSSGSGMQRLPSMLNCVGYFVRFSGSPDVPPFLQSILPERRRFRLYEWIEPSQSVEIYKAGGASDDWFKSRLFDASGEPQNTALLAENVVGLVLLAEYPNGSGGFSRRYLYDSRAADSKQTFSQLPPRIHVVMVAIDEASAQRLAAASGGSQPQITARSSWFVDPAQFESDLKQWELALQEVTPRIDYLFFNSIVTIQNSKWSL